MATKSDIEQLDATDLQILRVLQQNARLTIKEMANLVGLSSTPTYERMRRMERKGIIKKYIAVLDAEKLGQGLVVYCNVKLTKINNEIAGQFTRFIQEVPEVCECYNVSGSYDYLLKIHAEDMSAYRNFLLNIIGKMEYVSSVESTFVMDEIKMEYGIKF